MWLRPGLGPLLQKHRPAMKNNGNASRRLSHLWMNPKGDPVNKHSKASHPSVALASDSSFLSLRSVAPKFLQLLSQAPQRFSLPPKCALSSSPWSFLPTFILFCFPTNHFRFFPEQVPPSHFQLRVYFSITLIRPNQSPGTRLPVSSPTWAEAGGQQRWGQSRILSIVQRRGKEANSCQVKCSPWSPSHRQSCFTCWNCFHIYSKRKEKSGNNSKKNHHSLKASLPLKHNWNEIQKPKLGWDQMNVEAGGIVGLQQGRHRRKTGG